MVSLDAARSPVYSHLSSSLSSSVLPNTCVFLTNTGGPLPTVKHGCFSYSLIKLHSSRPLTVLFVNFKKAMSKVLVSINFSSVLEFAVKGFCTHYWGLIWIHAALFCLTLAGCNHLLSIYLLLQNQPFVTIFVSAFFFSFSSGAYC